MEAFDGRCGSWSSARKLESSAKDGIPLEMAWKSSFFGSVHRVPMYDTTILCHECLALNQSPNPQSAQHGVLD